MKATEARKKSADNTAAAEARRAAEYAAARKLEQQRRKEKLAKEKDTVKWELDACYRGIEAYTKEGYFRSKTSVVSEEIGKRVVRILRRDGYCAELHYDTVFTGVDEWEEHYYVDISWERNNENRSN